MSEQYDNTNRGVLFKNDRKTKDSHPDYKGNANLDGRDYWVSAWIKKGAKGTFMSMSYEAKDAAPEGHPERFAKAAQQQWPGATVTTRVRDDDGDIPF